MNPKISVIMVDGSFREHFFAVDSFCQQTLANTDYELIWVEYYSDIDRSLRETIDKYPNARVVTLDNDVSKLYHSSYCFNRGISEAKADILVIPDADVLVEKDFLSAVYDEHCKNRSLAMYCYRGCQEEEFFRENDYSFDYIKKTSVIPMAENYGGCLSTRKKWLIAIDGYEQHRAFASVNQANGKDVHSRLRNLGLYVKWHTEQLLLHPWHPGCGGVGADKKRVKWQLEIVKYRDANLMIKAFNGLTGNRSPELVPQPPLGDPDLRKRQ